MGKMKTPVMDVVRFGNEDVIATSDFVRVSGIGDGTRCNAVFTFGGQNHTSSGSAPYPAWSMPDKNSLFSALRSYYNLTAKSASGVSFDRLDLGSLVNHDSSTYESNYLKYNGKYEYAGNNKFNLVQ